MALTENTKTKALNEAKSLLQQYGYNGFSFQHVADALGLRKQSLYVHFKSKEELAEDILETYRISFHSWADTVSIFGPEEKIGAWFERFQRILNDDFKYCPLAAFASDYNSLPKNMQKKLNQVYELRRKWVAEVVLEGQQKKIFRRDLKPDQLAQIIVSCGFGSQQMARLSGNTKCIQEVTKDVMRILKND